MRRVAAMTRTGGYLLLRDLVFDLEPDDVEKGIADWMSGAVDDPACGFTANELNDYVREEFSTYTWLLEPILERCRFDILERSFIRIRNLSLPEEVKERSIPG